MRKGWGESGSGISNCLCGQGRYENGMQAERLPAAYAACVATDACFSLLLVPRDAPRYIRQWRIFSMTLFLDKRCKADGLAD